MTNEELDNLAAIEAERDQLKGQLKDVKNVLRLVLASARPHPMENVQMYQAWEEARKVLDSQNSKLSPPGSVDNSSPA